MVWQFPKNRPSRSNPQHRQSADFPLPFRPLEDVPSPNSTNAESPQLPRPSRPPQIPPQQKSTRRGRKPVSLVNFPEPRQRRKRSGGQPPKRRPSHRQRSQSLQMVASNPSLPTPLPTNPFPKAQEAPASSSEPSFRLLVWMLRLVILGVGLGAISGSVLAIVGPDIYLPYFNNLLNPTAEPSQEQATENIAPEPPPPLLNLTQEIAPLKEKFQALAAPHQQLHPQAFFYEVGTGAYVDLAGATPIAAASTIKVPVLVAFFQAVDAGQVRLDEMLTMTPDLVAGGSGLMQYQQPGTKFSALETATKMITISDNTATNMIIERLGGAEVLNAQFRDWGLTATAIRNPLPDLEGTNTTSPKDLVMLLARLERGELVSPRSRDRILRIMNATQTKTLLPKGLGEGATIAHKTGDIGSMVGDTGLIDLPNGKRYLAAVLVQRPHNNAQAKDLIRAYSQEAYQYFNAQTTPFVSSVSSSTVPE